jgi:hypothetical protein
MVLRTGKLAEGCKYTLFRLNEYGATYHFRPFCLTACRELSGPRSDRHLSGEDKYHGNRALPSLSKPHQISSHSKYFQLHGRGQRNFNSPTSDPG